MGRAERGGAGVSAASRRNVGPVSQRLSGRRRDDAITPGLTLATNPSLVGWQTGRFRAWQSTSRTGTLTVIRPRLDHWGERKQHRAVKLGFEVGRPASGVVVEAAGEPGTGEARAIQIRAA